MLSREVKVIWLTLNSPSVSEILALLRNILLLRMLLMSFGFLCVIAVLASLALWINNGWDVQIGRLGIQENHNGPPWGSVFLWPPSVLTCWVLHKVCLSLVFSLPFLLPTQSTATRAVSARPSTAEQQHRGQRPAAPGPAGPTGRPQPTDPGIGTGTNLIDHGSNKFADILFQMTILDF